MMRKLIVTLALLAALALSASKADALTLSPTNPTFQGYLNASKIATPRGTINFVVTADTSAYCGGPELGCADANLIVVWDQVPKSTFFHEVGHVFDFRELVNSERHALGIAMPGRPADASDWWTETAPPDEGSTNGEWFADSYAACSRDAPADMASHTYSTGNGLTSGVRMRDQVRPAIVAAYKR